MQQQKVEDEVERRRAEKEAANAKAKRERMIAARAKRKPTPPGEPRRKPRRTAPREPIAVTVSEALTLVPIGRSRLFAALDTLGLLTHPNFEQDPNGLAFDWQITRGLNSVSEFLPIGSEGERAFHVSFGMGRVQFPEVSQVVLLAPGKYRLEGKLRGSIIAKRGLRWQLRCASGARRSLGETEMLLGQSQEWRIFSLEVEIPQAEDCRGQTLRLFHDSRSASEEFISGEVWFTGLRLERVQEPLVVMQ